MFCTEVCSLQEDSILHGCIPVIVQDDIDVPLETLLNIGEFAIRYPRAKLDQLAEYLQSIPENEVRDRTNGALLG